MMTIDKTSLRRRWTYVVGCLSMLALTLVFLHSTFQSYSGTATIPLDLGHTKVLTGPLPHAPPATGLQKPEGLKIIALVFFGRKSRVEMMLCYLERNLVDRGGWLDEVHWVENTDKENDLAYLEQILARNQRYKKIDLSKEGIGFVGYGHAWEHLEPGNLYIKIDDDVVWFADDTIPRIVTRKVNNPNYLLVSANVINSPLMGWVHYHMGTQHPYLPELSEPSTSRSLISSPSEPPSWLASEYPLWSGPEEYFFPLDSGPLDGSYRWLRLPDHPNSTSIHRTPIAETEYATWGKALNNWPIAAQTHYSFLENLEDNNLHLYKTDGVWLTDYNRLSINFMCVSADDVLDNLPMDSVDEEWLTVNLPKKLEKSVAVEMSGLASHFSFGIQREGLEATDLLGRYKSYADELVCGVE